MKIRILLIVLTMAILLPMLISCDLLSNMLVVSETYVTQDDELIVVFTNGMSVNVGSIKELLEGECYSNTGTSKLPVSFVTPNLEHAKPIDPNPTDSQAPEFDSNAPASAITVRITYLDENGDLIVIFTDGSVKNLGKPQFEGDMGGTPILPEIWGSGDHGSGSTDSGNEQESREPKKFPMDRNNRNDDPVVGEGIF